jgi:hypothetical protein
MCAAHCYFEREKTDSGPEAKSRFVLATDAVYGEAELSQIHDVSR